jgi:hypothetical protein
VNVFVHLVGLAVIAATAWLVAAPLLGAPARAGGPPAADPERYRLEKEKELAYAAIKEAEFDFEMGKLSAQDYALLRGKYEARALAALAALDERK